jgi:hypothetical protein
MFISFFIDLSNDKSYLNNFIAISLIAIIFSYLFGSINFPFFIIFKNNLKIMILKIFSNK